MFAPWRVNPVHRTAVVSLVRAGARYDAVDKQGRSARSKMRYICSLRDNAIVIFICVAICGASVRKMVDRVVNTPSRISTKKAAAAADADSNVSDVSVDGDGDDDNRTASVVAVAAAGMLLLYSHSVATCAGR